MPIPQFHAEGQVGGDIVQVRICELAKQTINPKIKLGRRPPKLAALGTKFFKQADGVKLAAIFGVLTRRTKREHYTNGVKVALVGT